MWVVYVLQHSENKKFYFGYTKNLERRIKEHNDGMQTATKRNSGIWTLVYAEAYRSKQDALKREEMLKHHGSSKRKLLDRIQDSLLGD